MKVKIKDYISWWGPYQVADLLQHVGVSEETTYKIGTRLSKINWLNKLLTWNYDRQERYVKVKFDKFDTYSLDATLALVIHPALVEFKNIINTSSCAGYPSNMDVNDVPENSNTANDFEKWLAIIDEMIWTFEQIKVGGNEDQFYSGEADISWVDPDPNVDIFKDVTDNDLSPSTVAAISESGYKIMRTGPNDTFKVDTEGRKKHYERIENGLRLFSKYYRDLWW